MSRLLTNLEFLNKLYLVNKNVVPLESYKKSSIKIKVQCKVCGFVWMITPNNLLRGKSCPFCARKILSKQKRKSCEQFVKDLHSKYPTIVNLDRYTTSVNRLRFKCFQCDNVWSGVPSEVLQYGCPFCARLRIRVSMEDANERLHRCHPNVDIIGDYKGISSSAKLKCKRCGFVWIGDLKRILAAKLKDCPKCYHQLLKQRFESKRMSNDEFVHRLRCVTKTIVPLEKYSLSKSPILVKCTVCGYRWKVLPVSLLRGYHCPHCVKTGPHPSNYLSKSSLITRLKQDHPNIKWIGEYHGLKTKTKFECLNCGHVFYDTFFRLEKVRKDCPYCSTTCYSKQELDLFDWLNNHKIEVKHPFLECINPETGQPLHFDFYLPSYKLLIEIQGEQHFVPLPFFGGERALAIRQKHDRFKRQWAIDNGYKLLYIYYNESVINVLIRILSELDKEDQSEYFVLNERTL